MAASKIHPTALVSPKSRIGRNVSIGAYTIIEEGVSIGEGTTILNHVTVRKGTTMGKNNAIHMGAVIGHEAQNKSSSPETQSFLNIGDDNIFREYVTVNRGSADQSATSIGDRNYFMISSHVGHDCIVKNDIVLTNAVLLGGHVFLDDHCILSGGSGVHQFCRIGTYAMIGGHSSITKDVPPYMLVDDGEDRIGSLNIVGLRRAGFSEEVKRDIKNAYKLLYLSGLNVTQAIESIARRCHSKEVSGLVQFMKDSKRGILGHRKRKEIFLQPVLHN